MITSISILILDAPLKKWGRQIIAACIYKGILKKVSRSCVEVPQQGSLINVNAMAYLQIHFAMTQAWHNSCKDDE